MNRNILPARIEVGNLFKTVVHVSNFTQSVGKVFTQILLLQIYTRNYLLAQISALYMLSAFEL